jgi:hypothetical protein
MKKVVSVSPLDNFELSLEFDLHEKKVFDVKPYLHRGIFTQPQDRDYFKQVKLFLGSITWPHGQDFDPDHLYLESRDAAIEKACAIDRDGWLGVFRNHTVAIIGAGKVDTAAANSILCASISAIACLSILTAPLPKVSL